MSASRVAEYCLAAAKSCRVLLASTLLELMVMVFEEILPTRAEKESGVTSLNEL